MKYYLFSHKENKNTITFKKFLSRFGITFAIYGTLPPIYLQSIYNNKFINYIVKKDIDDYYAICFYDDDTPKSYIESIKHQKKNYDIIMVNYFKLTHLDIQILYNLLNISLYSLHFFPRFTKKRKALIGGGFRVIESFNTYTFKPKQKPNKFRQKRKINNEKKDRIKILTTKKAIPERKKKVGITIIEKKITRMPKIIMSENSFRISSNDPNNQILDSYCYPNKNMLIYNTLLIKNGQLGVNTNGGIMNPGYIKYNDKRYILCQGEKNGKIYKKYHAYDTGIPILCEIKKDSDRIVLVDSWEMKINLPSSIRTEDYRLYNYMNNIYSNHVLYYLKMGSNGEHYKCHSMAVSKVDIENKKLEFLYELQYKNELCEKNWGFINKNDNIYIIKHLVPYTVLKLDHATGQCQEYIKKYYNILQKYKWSMSANPIIFNDDYYITFIHRFHRINSKKYTPKKIYTHHILLIDRETLLPKIILVKPIFNIKNIDNSDTRNYIHYISSISIEDDKLYIYFGESDINVGYSILDLQIINDEITAHGEQIGK